MMADEFKPRDKVAKCEKCGEPITYQQYQNGNYFGNNGHADTHVTCRRGWQARALARCAEAQASDGDVTVNKDGKTPAEEQKANLKAAAAGALTKLTIIKGNYLRRPEVGEEVPEGIDLIHQVHLIFCPKDPVEIRRQILNFLRSYIKYDDVLQDKASEAWIDWQGTEYTIERKFNIKKWRPVKRGWNVLAHPIKHGDGLYHYCPAEKFVMEPHFD